MIDFSLRVAKILGTSSDTAWSQSYFFTPENKELLEKRGSLLACFSLSAVGQEGINSEFGQDLIDRLQREYYDQTVDLPMQRLVSSLEAIRDEVVESQLDFTVEIVAGVFWNGLWYFAVLGEGKVLVKRGPTISAVLVGESKEEVVSSSGKAERGDLIVLGTTGFYILRDDLIQQALGEEDLKKVAGRLSEGLSSAPDNGHAAGLVIELVVEKEVSPTSGAVSEKPDHQKKMLFRSLPSFGGRRWLLPVIALVPILIVGGYFFFRQQSLNRQNLAQEVIAQVENKYQEAQGLAMLDKDQAARIIAEAQDLLAKTSFDRASQKEADQLKQNLDQFLTSLTQAPPEPTDSLGEFSSLAEADSELALADLSSAGKTIYLLDNDNGKVYSLGWEDKKLSVVLGEEKIKKATKLFFQAGKIILLADDGFYEIANNKLNKIIEIDDSWGKIVDFYGWLGNLYLLDTQNNLVWQYPATQGGFGAIKKWNKEDLPAISDGASISIDAAIWLASGKLYKLYQGYLEDTYNVPDLGVDVLVYTEADFDNVYLVDKENSRFLAVNKETGETSDETRAIGLDEAKGLIVSPDETVAVIGTPDKLLKVVLD
ncbi:MAG: hypothetical protein PHR64_03190 [Candidatus Shapirobacteria bacterium]|nr:hypothetical protein [Candidatus Shapirobacteria bacterium]MDD5074144.1 hypothetical protein [Candidatus Shapirobacteria bacterium]MDD5481915.1 hypothetical protein [Candidatus Shapirobacteria bacterium]